MNDLAFKIRPDDEDHHANMAGWINFQRVCIGKLNRKRREEDRSGWNDPAQCDECDLRQMMLEHMVRLQPQKFSDDALFDVANIAMMIWNHRRIVSGAKAIMPDDSE